MGFYYLYRSLQAMRLCLSPNIITLCIAIFITHTLQVDIAMESPANPARNEQPLSITCTNIDPGVCCIFPVRGAEIVTFNHLTAFDIAAVWRSRYVPGPTYQALDCSGSVLHSGTGPGIFTWEGTRSARGYVLEKAVGASYITLPRSLPPDDMVKGWMLVEGLLGLAWGGGKWFASPAAQRLLAGGSSVVPRSRLRRNIRSVEKGDVYARSPPRSVLPDQVVWDGTLYTGNGSADAMYLDTTTGRDVDLMALLNSNNPK
ncbi:MAG: hypothetical protein Q9170_003786 [Blastenia crenularia]